MAHEPGSTPGTKPGPPDVSYAIVMSASIEGPGMFDLFVSGGCKRALAARRGPADAR